MQLAYEIYFNSLYMCYSAVHILIYLLDIVLNYRYCQCITCIVLWLSADMLNRIPSLSTSCSSIKKIVSFTIINPSNNSAEYDV